jgi:predicted membrane chloride channel (bestrophin family)
MHPSLTILLLLPSSYPFSIYVISSLFLRSFLFSSPFSFPSPSPPPLRPSGSALGLLLVFRTNTAYNRFWEGRRIWERILTSLRDLGRMTVVYGDVIESTRVERILHLLCAFPLGVSLSVVHYFLLALVFLRVLQHFCLRILPSFQNYDNLSNFAFVCC